MPAGISDTAEKVVLATFAALLGFALGAFNPPIVRWWKRRHSRQDAARLFRRDLESLVGPLGAVRVHFEGSNGILQALGPRIFRETIAGLSASVAAFESHRATLLDLRDDALEVRLTRFFEGVESSGKGLEKFASPYHPENIHPDMSYHPAYQQNLMFMEDAKSKLTNASLLVERLRGLE